MFSKVYASLIALPPKFRVLVAASFIDRIGGTMLFPFFALYVTRRFNVGMTEAGLLLGIFGLTGLIGSVVGGALADKIGRKKLIIFGLLSSAAGSVGMGLVDSLGAFYALAAVSGLLNSVAGPAYGAMVADMLPEEQRSEGFGLLRVAGNLAWILGPTLGGLLAAQSYLYLFLADAVTSTITAAIAFRMLPETKPEPQAGAETQSFLRTIAGYGVVARDGLFVAFIIASVLMGIVYQQMYSTLAVYLSQVHGLPDRNYGLLLSIDAFVVVLFQFPVTSLTKKYAPMLMMALGTALYMVGFTMYGFVAGMAMFVVAIVIITFGEMIVIPVSQALAARFAPEAMRGRYMAFFEVSWSIPSMIGPAAAGLIMDNYNPNWVWYLCGIIALVAAAAFYGLHYATQARFEATAQEA